MEQTIEIKSLDDVRNFNKQLQRRLLPAKCVKVTTIDSSSNEKQTTKIEQTYEFDNGEKLIVRSSQPLKGDEADEADKLAGEIEQMIADNGFITFEENEGLGIQILFRLTVEELKRLATIRDEDKKRKKEEEEEEDDEFDEDDDDGWDDDWDEDEDDLDDEEDNEPDSY